RAGSTPKLFRSVGSGPDYATWLSVTAASALPPSGNSVPISATGRVWTLPAIPPVNIPSNVPAFDSSVNQQTADRWAHDVVLDLIIESEARRTHDTNLAEGGARRVGVP